MFRSPPSHSRNPFLCRSRRSEGQLRGGVAGMERWDDGGDYFLSFSQAMERLKFAKIPSVNSFSKRKGDYLRNEK